MNRRTLPWSDAASLVEKSLLRISAGMLVSFSSTTPQVSLKKTYSNSVLSIYLYMETFSMRSVVSVSVMMMPFGETVSVTFRNFLALALACGYEKHKSTLKSDTEKSCHRYSESVTLINIK